MNLVLFCGVIVFSLANPTTSYRTWSCNDNKCVKTETDSFEKSVSLSECKLLCLKYGGLWPKPTGSFSLGNGTVNLDPSMISFEKHEYPYEVNALMKEAESDFLNKIRNMAKTMDYSSIKTIYGMKLNVNVYDPSVSYFTSDVDESYTLNFKLSPNETDIKVFIKSNTYHGYRHALTTFLQLICYDDLRNALKVINEAHIKDKPVFKHRGIALDTSRSYISVDNILKLIRIMSDNKLNTLHWHITDSHSFPYVSKAYPELSRDGAYSKHQVYNESDIKKIVKTAQWNGIRIVPEFDSPAHVGEGWNALDPNLITCFKWQPWRDYCVEPPCGQLDITNEKIYKVLGTIYKEYVDLFNSDLFHLGGDEVNINCWRSTPRIQEWMTKHNYSQTNRGYYKLWGEYQEKSLKELKKTKTDPHPQAILWTSTLTEPHLINQYLSPEDYIIQIWTLKRDPTIRSLIENKFRVIFSNYDELYFDCGGPSWVGEPGQNWCSPYIGWQYVYQHSPYQILKKQGFNITDDIKKLVLGSEAAIWTEQINDHNLHLRLWPRAAALAESLWSSPEEDWKDAQFRMNHHRERIASEVPTELLQPQWCYQNDGFCD